MSMLYLIAIAFVIVGLQGCAPVPVRPQPVSPPGSISVASIPPGTPTCPVNQNLTGDCVIELAASDDPADPRGCIIKLINEDDDLITLKGARGKFIYWRIVNSPKYKFTRDGIAFIDNFRPRVFNEGERGGVDENEFQWKFTGSKRRVNGYVINVRKPASSGQPARECELDPWIRNK